MPPNCFSPSRDLAIRLLLEFEWKKVRLHLIMLIFGFLIFFFIFYNEVWENAYLHAKYTLRKVVKEDVQLRRYILKFFFIYNQWLLPWWYLYDVIINSKKTRLWKFYLIELDGISRVIFCINVSIYYTNKIHLKYLMYVLSKEKIKHEKYIKTLWPQTRIIHLKYLMYVFFCFS